MNDPLRVAKHEMGAPNHMMGLPNGCPFSGIIESYSGIGFAATSMGAFDVAGILLGGLLNGLLRLSMPLLDIASSPM